MPDFFSEGDAPRRTDTLWKIEQKILSVLITGVVGGGSGQNPNRSGMGSPVGTITPDYVGQYYTDLTDPYDTYFSVGLTDADWVMNTGGITQ